MPARRNTPTQWMREADHKVTTLGRSARSVVADLAAERERLTAKLEAEEIKHEGDWPAIEAEMKRYQGDWPEPEQAQAEKKGEDPKLSHEDSFSVYNRAGDKLADIHGGALYGDSHLIIRMPSDAGTAITTVTCFGAGDWFQLSEMAKNIGEAMLAARQIKEL